MRALPLLVLLPLLVVPFAMAALPSTPTPLPVPPVVASQFATAPFSKVVCPGPIAGDPLRALDVCDMRATSTNGPGSEISIAMDPQDPAHYIVVAKGQPAQRMTGGLLRGEVVTPYSTTFDGGLTWTEGFLQAVTPTVTLPVLGPVGETSNWESDPVAAFAPNGDVMVETLRVNHGGGLPIYRSTDGGRTFTEVSKAFNGGTDKNWVAVDRARGIMYSVTANFNARCGNVGSMCVTKSMDNGQTWGPQVEVCPACSYAMLDVGPDGTVYVGGYCYCDDSLYVAKSTDQGAHWGAPVRVARHDGNGWSPVNLRWYRTTNIAQMAVDKGSGPFSGSVYVVWAGHSPGSPTAHLPVCIPFPTAPGCVHVPDYDVFISYSRDHGATWSAPLRINDDPTSLPTQFLATVAVSPKGDVHAAWMDERWDRVVNNRTVACPVRLMRGCSVTRLVPGEAGPAIVLVALIAATALPVRADATLPDLVVGGAPTVLPDPLHPGQWPTFSVVVRNQGSAPAGDFSVRFRVDGNISEGDLPFRGTLDAGSSVRVTSRAWWNATRGAHTLDVAVDMFHSIAESNETNNAAHLDFVAGWPDLVVAPRVLVDPAWQGDLPVQATVTNVGDLPSPPTKLQWEANAWGGEQVPVLQPGQSSMQNATLDLFWRWNPPGDGVLQATVDPDNVVDEGPSEWNNAGAQPFHIAGPDFHVTELTAEPLDPVVGENVTFHARVVNDGDGPGGEELWLLQGWNTYGGTAYALGWMEFWLAPGDAATMNMTWSAALPADRAFTAHAMNEE
ncbi:MAG: hypothetical protein LC624_11860, partial [Halobacteriales archaeon]|nr:hypothetical protein [Halobacteriales archaeon]